MDATTDTNDVGKIQALESRIRTSDLLNKDLQKENATLKEQVKIEKENIVELKQQIVEKQKMCVQLQEKAHKFDIIKKNFKLNDKANELIK